MTWRKNWKSILRFLGDENETSFIRISHILKNVNHEIAKYFKSIWKIVERKKNGQKVDRKVKK